MKKSVSYVCIATLALALTACGSGSDDKEKTDSKNTATETNAESFRLGEYKGLAAEKTIFSVSDEDIQYEIDSLLADYIEYKELDSPAEVGNYVNISLTGFVGDQLLIDYSDAEEGGYDICIGEATLGEEFDDKMTGVTTGQELSFSITYEDDFYDADLAGNTVDYQVTVNSVTEEVIPEMTQEFIVDSLGYESEEDMRSKITESLAADNENYSEYMLRDELMQQVIAGSTFGSYSEDLYMSCKAKVESEYASYAEMFGCENVQEVYEMFGMTDEDVESEVIDEVHRQQVINEICKLENISVTDDIYKERAEQYAEDYGYDSVEDLEADQGKETVEEWIREDLVMDVLVQNAVITEVQNDVIEATDGDAGEEFEE